MSAALNLSQFLPGALLVAGVVLLSLFLVMNIRHRIARRTQVDDPRKFIREVREQAEAGVFPAHLQDQPRRRPRATKATASAVATAGETDRDRRPERRQTGSHRTSVDSSAESDLASQAMRELDETARRVLAQLDTRITIVEKVIRDADERLEMIRSLLDQAPGASISPSKLAAADRFFTGHELPEITEAASLRHENDPVAERSAQISIKPSTINAGDLESSDVPPEIAADLAGNQHDHTESNGRRPPAIVNGRIPPKNSTANGRATSETDPERAVLEAPDEPAAEVAEESRIRRQIDSLSENVYELADRGMSAVAIAQDLDEHVGKVELILALRPKSPAHGCASGISRPR